MKSLISFLKENVNGVSLIDFLFERRTINFGTANPNYNQCVILAGGAASGKGFIQHKINLQGKVLDVDELKSQYKKMVSKGIIDDKEYDLANKEDCNELHQKIKGKGWDDKRKHHLFDTDKHKQEGSEKRLPNVIFDMVSKDVKDIEEVLGYVVPMGYTVTIVWVVTNTDTAAMNNELRGIGSIKKRRSVPDEVLRKGHAGAYKTMTDFLSNKYENLNQFIDFFWIGFGTGFGRKMEEKYEKSPVEKIKKVDGKWQFDKNMVDDFMKEQQPFNDEFCKACNEGDWDKAAKAGGQKNDEYLKKKWEVFSDKYPEAKEIK